MLVCGPWPATFQKNDWPAGNIASETFGIRTDCSVVYTWYATFTAPSVRMWTAWIWFGGAVNVKSVVAPAVPPSAGAVSSAGASIWYVTSVLASIAGWTKYEDLAVSPVPSMISE